MKKFFVLLKKEIKELLTPQMLVPMLLVVLVFMFVGKIVGKETAKSQVKQTVAVVDLDRSSSSKQLIDAVNQGQINVMLSDKTDTPAALKVAKQNGAKALIVIPEGFDSNLKQGQASELQLYTVLSNFSFVGSRGGDSVLAALAQANEVFSNQLISSQASGRDLNFLKRPLQIQNFVTVGDKSAQVIPAAVMGFISSQTTFIPIILFLVIVMASQLIALSIATEKENKTLETLLSVPVSRQSIVAAKLVAAGVVALLMAGLYLFGLSRYMQGFSAPGQTVNTAAAQEAVRQLGLVMTAGDYLLLGLSLFFGILAALSMAIILGSFAEDSKSVQGVTAPLMVLVLIPYFLTLFLDVNSLPAALKIFVYTIPFSHPFLAAPNILLGHYQQVVYGILYLLAFFAIAVYVASKLFASDKILTLKLSFKKRK